MGRRSTRASLSAPSPPERQIADAAVRTLRLLAERWPEEPRFPLLRSVGLWAFYLEFAVAYGMSVPALGIVMPELDDELVVDVRALIQSLPLRDMTPEHFGAAHEALTGYALRGRDVISTSDRRARGVHFTPRAMTEPIVRKTLEPLFAIVPPERTLELRVCDPAVGAGAFLVELVRQLGQRVLAAGGASTMDEAKRLAAIHCAYGVDICRWGVTATKLALRLECRADRMPLDWLDDNVKHGDALVGLTNDQIKASHWDAKRAPKDIFEASARERIGRVVDEVMNADVAARRACMAQLADAARRVA
jgi:hypothetical protein